MRDEFWLRTLRIVANLLGALAVLAIIAVLVSGCGCPSAYLYDGSTGPDARPYYKLEKCKDKRPRIVCDSPTPLPTATCK